MLHTNDRIIKHKVGLLNLADELGNISKACKMMGVSRDTFYSWRIIICHISYVPRIRCQHHSARVFEWPLPAPIFSRLDSGLDCKAEETQAKRRII